MVIKTVLYDAVYIIINYFISYIPFWSIRKILYRLFGLKIGKGSRINMKCVLFEPWNISIGSGTIVNEYCLLDGRGGLRIGNNCSISMYSIIYTSSHRTNSDHFDYFEKESVICNGVWIGARATIMPGVVLKDCCVIGANSVASKGEYEEKSIYVGIPAIKTHNRDVTEISELHHHMFFR